MKLEQALVRASLFDEITTREVALLSRVMVESAHGAGHVLVREGQRMHPVADALFVVLDGRVEVVSAARTAAGQGPLAVLGPGDFFGILALIEDGPHAAGCIAQTPVRIASLGRRALDLLRRSQPGVAAALEHALARQLARDVRSGNAVLRGLLLKHAGRPG